MVRCATHVCLLTGLAGGDGPRSAGRSTWAAHEDIEVRPHGLRLYLKAPAVELTGASRCSPYRCHCVGQGWRGAERACWIQRDHDYEGVP